LYKCCVQLGARPRIINSMNAVPVDHVSHLVIAVAFNSLPGVNVVHITAHPQLRINEFLSTLSYYSYHIPEVDYEEWETQLDEFVSAGSVEKDQEQSAGEGITREDIGRYLRFLVEIKFMPWPTGRGRELPPIAADVA
ncbi:hypothetical protein EDB81DRAFT_668794, partial [Dactylonectria macrodidyma]